MKLSFQRHLCNNNVRPKRKFEKPKRWKRGELETLFLSGICGCHATHWNSYLVNWKVKNILEKAFISMFPIRSGNIIPALRGNLVLIAKIIVEFSFENNIFTQNFTVLIGLVALRSFRGTQGGCTRNWWHTLFAEQGLFRLTLLKSLLKAHSHLPQQSADSTEDCVNTEIGIFLSLCGNTTVCHRLQHQMHLLWMGLTSMLHGSHYTSREF